MIASLAAPNAAPKSLFSGISRSIFKTVAISSSQYEEFDPPPIAIAVEIFVPAIFKASRLSLRAKLTPSKTDCVRSFWLEDTSRFTNDALMLLSLCGVLSPER